jgi:F-type H+-transporting ATPase subunit b
MEIVMKRFFTLVTILAAMFAALSASPAFAAPEGDGHAAAAHGPDVLPGAKGGLAPAITTLVAFAIVFFFMYAKVWPKITAGLEERSAKIRQEIAAAEAARKQAKMALDDYESSLSQARAEAQKMLEETKAQQVALAAELRAKADADLNAMRERAKRDIEAAKRAALNEIYAQSVGLATTMASKILQREINAGDQQKLVEDSLAEMQARSN